MNINNKIILNEISMIISSLAVQAMLYEVSCFPTPGLVSPVSNGAHKDMNYYTFIDSTSVLSRYFALFVQEGLSHSTYSEVFKSIRSIGIEAEKEMFVKTEGINTHKGMLFLMGVVCAAVGKAFYERKNFKYIQTIIKEMTAGLVEKELLSLKDNDILSHGEKIFLKYNRDGVRGEVERGIPTVFNFSLDFYKQSMNITNINDRLVHTLIGIMQVCEDSTIIHRHSIEVLNEVKEKAKDIITSGGMRTLKGRDMIHNLSIEFVERNISPGGSADLLALTVFLQLVEKYMSEIYKLE